MRFEDQSCSSTRDNLILFALLFVFSKSSIRFNKWIVSKMKFSVVAIAALSSVLAAPQGNPLTSGLENLVGKSIEKNLERQTGKKRPTGPDTFRLNRCVPAVLVVARGTSETGNVVSHVVFCIVKSNTLGNYHRWSNMHCFKRSTR